MLVRSVLVRWSLTALLLASATLPAHGMYAKPQLEEVPVERLVENLTKQADANPKDATIRLNLARVHAMAYAKKSSSLQSQKGRKDQTAWLGFEPRHVPFDIKKTEDAGQQKAAEQQLAAAVADYQKAVELAPDDLTAQLGYGWCLEQSGQKDKAIAEYRKVIKKGWDKERSIELGDLGWHSVVVEASGYLKPHLDAKTDKAELDDLKAKSDKLAKVPRPVTPIAIPLAAGLSAQDIEARNAHVKFDLDGSGKKTWSWIKPNAAWLVYDQHDAAKPASGLQLFGNVTFWCFWDNGYQALHSLDNNGDGQLTGDELQHLALWHDANGNGIADPGEVQPLAQYGITALSCEYKIDAAHPDRIACSPRGVTFRTGEVRPSYDLLLHPQK